MREPLHNRRANETQELTRDGIRVTFTVGFKPDGSIGELFMNADRTDSMINAICADGAALDHIISPEVNS